jgi:hypothetical protein
MRCGSEGHLSIINAINFTTISQSIVKTTDFDRKDDQSHNLNRNLTISIVNTTDFDRKDDQSHNLNCKYDGF